MEKLLTFLQQTFLNVLAIFQDTNYNIILANNFLSFEQLAPYLFVLKFYGPVNPMGTSRAWSVYLTTGLLGRLSPLSG